MPPPELVRRHVKETEDREWPGHPLCEGTYLNRENILLKIPTGDQDPFSRTRRLISNIRDHLMTILEARVDQSAVTEYIFKGASSSDASPFSHS